MKRCLADAGIVRHRGKIESVINNAKRARELIDEAGSLAAFVWRYEPDPKSRPKRIDRGDILPTSPESIALSKELRKRGWSFVGPTTVYAFMQAMGLVNDHLDGCACREEAESGPARLRAAKIAGRHWSGLTPTAFPCKRAVTLTQPDATLA